MRALLARIERLERGGVRAVDPPAAGQGAGNGDHQGSPQAAGVDGAAASVDGAVPEQAIGQDTEAAQDTPVPVVDEERAAEPAARDLESVCALWPAVVDLVRGENARLGAAIEMSRPVEVEGKELTLAFSSSFLKKQAEKPEDRVTIAEALQAVTGGRWQLSYELREEQAPADGPAPAQHSEEEWVARFMREFDAEEIVVEESPENERGEQAVTSNERGA
jgi:hypothetical protein